MPSTPMARRWPCLILCLALAGAAALVVGARDARADVAVSTVAASADASVREDLPTTNAGGTATLVTDGSPRREALLRFAVPRLAGPLVRAEVRLWVETATGGGVQLHRTSGAWDEQTVTWNSRPASGAVVAESGPTVAGGWATLDVTSLVSSGAVLEVALSSYTSTNSRTIRSREATSLGPQLVVTTQSGDTAPTSGAVPVVAAVGDIACSPLNADFNNGLGNGNRCEQLAVSTLVDQPDVSEVLAVGDLQYDGGSLSDFRGSYDKSWGRVKSKTRPVPGNHEYGTPGAAGYFDYFGSAAGDRDKGWYSFDVGTWHVVALNSNCTEVACTRDSAQERWLRADLAAHPRTCVLAFWHHPLYSSGWHGRNDSVQPLYSALHDAGADVVVSGHDHVYERFGRQDAVGRLDAARGLRQFVVGTGGKELTGFGTVLPNSEVRLATHGVLKLALRPTGYDWRFVRAGTGDVLDSGSTECSA